MSKYNSIIFGILLVLISSCDSNRIHDEFTTIPNDSWYYKKNLNFDVDIQDTNIFYNLYFNVRINSDYRYSNIFIWLQSLSPDKKNSKQRFDFTLADESGKWLGKGLGDLYDYRLPLYKHYRFHQKGIYRFSIEQNMRDDTLTCVKAAGLRVEKEIN